MFVISKAKSGKEVGTALEELIEEINKELENADGMINCLEGEVAVGPLEANVSVSVFLDGDELVEKFLIGVNEKAYDRESSMKKAQKHINQMLTDRKGNIAGYFIKTITSPLGRVYTTLIIAVNSGTFKSLNGADTESRRTRIKKGLELFGNDPSVLNVAQLAHQFGVSRTMIYKDLEVLGFKRG